MTELLSGEQPSNYSLSNVTGKMTGAEFLRGIPVTQTTIETIHG